MLEVISGNFLCIIINKVLLFLFDIDMYIANSIKVVFPKAYCEL